VLQVLVTLPSCDLEWGAARGGSVPAGAVIGGHNSKGEDLYVCRAELDGARLVGKVNREHGVCYLPHEGREVAVPSYSALVLAPPPSHPPPVTALPASATVTAAFLPPPSSPRPRVATPLLVTSAIAKLFAQFAAGRPASDPIARPNPLEGRSARPHGKCTFLDRSRNRE
jgi:hypothetical protein